MRNISSYVENILGKELTEKKVDAIIEDGMNAREGEV